MKFFKNQNGISILVLCLIIVILIVLIFFVFGGAANNRSVDTETSSSSIVKKEDRSTYIAKCSSIDYTSLARNPNQYKGTNYKFTGEVIQVMNNDYNVTLRVNVTPKKYSFSNETYYEDTILVSYTYSSSYESKILEDDIVTIYGQSMGTYTYESVLGSPVTVPAINALYIDIK